MDKSMSIGECSTLTLTEVMRRILSEIIVSMRLRGLRGGAWIYQTGGRRGLLDFRLRIRIMHAAVT